jgi:hypothetical protein
MARYAAGLSDDPAHRATGTMFLTSPSMFRDDIDEILHEFDCGLASHMNPSCMVAELDIVPMDHAYAVMASLQEEEGCDGIPVTAMSSKLLAASDPEPMPKSVTFKPEVEVNLLTPSISEDDTDWAPIDPQLCPCISMEIASCYRDGAYHPSVEDQKVHAAFFKKHSNVVSLKQSEAATALGFFDPRDKLVIIPKTVLVDTSICLMVCISRPLAESLGLTWVPSSAALVGV